MDYKTRRYKQGLEGKKPSAVERSVPVVEAVNPLDDAVGAPAVAQLFVLMLVNGSV
jgi:hypothetical protein